MNSTTTPTEAVVAPVVVVVELARQSPHHEQSCNRKRWFAISSIGRYSHGTDLSLLEQNPHTSTISATLFVSNYNMSCLQRPYLYLYVEFLICFCAMSSLGEKVWRVEFIHVSQFFHQRDYHGSNGVFHGRLSKLFPFRPLSFFHLSVMMHSGVVLGNIIKAVHRVSV